MASSDILYAQIEMVTRVNAVLSSPPGNRDYDFTFYQTVSDGSGNNQIVGAFRERSVTIPSSAPVTLDLSSGTDPMSTAGSNVPSSTPASTAKLRGIAIANLDTTALGTPTQRYIRLTFTPGSNDIGGIVGNVGGTAGTYDIPPGGAWFHWMPAGPVASSPNNELGTRGTVDAQAVTADVTAFIVYYFG